MVDLRSRSRLHTYLVNIELDRSSFVPLYFQLQEALKEEIESGAWPSGAQLPSELELGRRFSVSRVVVRRALAILEADGQIIRARGRGTFVAPTKLNYPVGGLLRSLVGLRYSNVTVRILDRRVVRAEGAVRDRLEIPARLSPLRITAQYSIDTVPVSMGYSFFHPRERPEVVASLPVGEVTGVSLKRSRFPVAYTSLTIEAGSCPSQFDSRWLGIPLGAPTFLVLSTDYRAAGETMRPIEVARIAYRADIVQFELDAASFGHNGAGAAWATRAQTP